MDEDMLDIDKALQAAPAEQASWNPEMRAKNLRLQAISFAFGNLRLSGSDVTREMIEEEYDKLYGGNK